MRAHIYHQIRTFFAERKVLEVTTPHLVTAAVTDPHIESITVADKRYLRTSPEYAMKRLLAGGSGDIYQLSASFRAGDVGQYHHPEFTLLEWYRLGWNSATLRNEITELVGLLLGQRTVRTHDYADLFAQHFSCDPHHASVDELAAIAQQHITICAEESDPLFWLDLLFSHIIAPTLGQNHFDFIYNYPTSQAALAQWTQDEQGRVVADRFELYIDGMEIANGCRELTDAAEHRRRFAEDQRQRQTAHAPLYSADEDFLAAIDAGLPSCAGVAVGIDRIVMIAANLTHIQQAMTFAVA